MKTNTIVAKIQVSRARDGEALITDLPAIVDDGVEATEDGVKNWAKAGLEEMFAKDFTLEDFTIANLSEVVEKLKAL